MALNTKLNVNMKRSDVVMHSGNGATNSVQAVPAVQREVY